MKLLRSTLLRRATKEGYVCGYSSAMSIGRPELDFDYLLDPRKRLEIAKNIEKRKQVGNIGLVVDLWKRIEDIMSHRKASDVASVTQLRQLWDQFYAQAELIPNRTHSQTPTDKAKMVQVIGNASSTNITRGNILAEKIAIKAKTLFHPTIVAGSRSYILKGGLSKVEHRMVCVAYEKAIDAGYKPISVPDVIPRNVIEGCGLTQRSDHPIVYTMKDDCNYCLSGTAEMAIAGFLAGKTLNHSDLPLRIVAKSRCFRPEVAGSQMEGGLYRVHEFTKVELFCVVEDDTDKSEEALSEIIQFQRNLCHLLQLNGRLMEMPSEELGAAAYRKYDIEMWMPARAAFGEVCSASNCTDYQSRRLNIRFKHRDGSTRFVHTCNGTGLASTRSLVALLETFQQTDDRGAVSLRPPKQLRNLLLMKRTSHLPSFQTVASR